MIFYLLLIIAFCLDMITLYKSNNTQDKIPYIVAMIVIGIIGAVFLKYGTDAKIADRILKLFNLDGGI